MLHTRFLLFTRLFLNQWSVYTLKLISLAIAFACGILVIGFASREFTVDTDVQDSASIFRVLQKNESPDYGRNRLTDRIPPKVHEVMNSIGRDTLIVSRVKVLEQVTALAPGRSLSGLPFHAADQFIIDVFKLDFVHGTAFAHYPDRRTVLLSESASQKLFETTNSMGQRLQIFTLNDTVTCYVSAVFKASENMHEDFQVFVILNDEDLERQGYEHGDYSIYGKLTGLCPSEVLERLITRRAAEPEMPFRPNIQECSHGLSPDIYRAHENKPKVTYHLQAIEDIYFGPRVTGENARHGDAYSNWILICISTLIILLAVTNYANLTTLTLPRRSTELAIGKVAGAESLKLCMRLIQESVFMCLISLALAAVLLSLSASFLRRYFSLDIAEWTSSLGLLPILLIIVLMLIAVLAPLYPIIAFTTATPQRLLSPEVISFARLKRLITTLQLGSSISLIVAGLVIERQIDRSLIKEPGRNQDQVVYLKYPKELTKLDELKLGWKRHNPNIVNVTAASQLPNNLQSKDASGRFHKIRVDHDFFSFFDLRLVSGRFFKVNDQDSSIWNEFAMSRKVGTRPIGIVQDFGSRFNQPDRSIQIMQAGDHRDYSFLFIRVLEVNIRDTEAYLYRFFKEITDDPISISYLDQRFERMLRYEDTLNGLSRLLTLIGIAMACCAIYALSLSRVNDNLKQIAIRRTFGASRQQIVFLLSREFIQELLAACFFFGPITFLLLRGWLKNFVYAAHMHWIDPLLALAACVLIITFTNTSLIFNMSRRTTSGALKR